MAKRILDEATKKALMGVAPLSSNSRFRFTPDVFSKINVADEYKPAFFIRGLTIEEAQELDKLVSESATMGIDKDAWNAKAFDLARRLIVDWENVFDIGTGEEIIFIAEANSCAPSIFNQLTLIIKNQLFGQIMKMHGLLDTAKMGLL